MELLKEGIKGGQEEKSFNFKVAQNRRMKDDLDEIPELSPLGKAVLYILIISVLLWAYIKNNISLKYIPLNSWAQSITNTAHLIVSILIFIGKIILIVLIIAVVLYVIYKLYEYIEDNKDHYEYNLNTDSTSEEEFDDYIADDDNNTLNTLNNEIADIIAAIEEFEPPRKYSREENYHHTLFTWLKARFPAAKIEHQVKSSRPDIVIGDVAVEVKGPTGSRELQTLADKILRYCNSFKYIILVLFDVKVNPTRYSEWESGIKNNFSNVYIIRKDFTVNSHSRRKHKKTNKRNRRNRKYKYR